jgi:hypothetical protein
VSLCLCPPIPFEVIGDLNEILYGDEVIQGDREVAIFNSKTSNILKWVRIRVLRWTQYLDHPALINSGLGLICVVGFPWLHHIPFLALLNIGLGRNQTKFPTAVREKYSVRLFSSTESSVVDVQERMLNNFVCRNFLSEFKLFLFMYKNIQKAHYGKIFLLTFYTRIDLTFSTF